MVNYRQLSNEHLITLEPRPLGEAEHHELVRSNNNGGRNVQGYPQGPGMFQLMQTLAGVVHQQQQQQNVTMQLRNTGGITEFK